MIQKLKETIIGTAEYYGKQLSPSVLLMYVEDLEDLPPEKCVEAYRTYRRNPANKFFPLPAQIREIVSPNEFVSVESRAREIAARIVGAVSKFGWPNGQAAKEYIGEDGWHVVETQGGWSHLCENLGMNIQPTTFQAQIRDQLLGLLKHGKVAMEQKILQSGGHRIGELNQPSNVLSVITNKQSEETT